jgi:NAD(P)-dependent dehydrogenase (short-subunit alcohol dehydrogenase family)
MHLIKFELIVSARVLSPPHTSCLSSGAIESPLMRGIINNDAIRQHVTNLIPMKRIGEAQEAANYIVFLLSEKASYITGNITQIDGGMLAG